MLADMSSGVGRHWGLTGPAGVGYDDFGMFRFDHFTLELTWSPDFDKYLRYCKVVLEAGDDECNYVHWHVYAILHKCARFAGVKKLFGSDEWHCEQVKDAAKWHRYVSGTKNGAPKENCLFPPTARGQFEGTPGKRSDLLEFADALKASRKLDEVARALPTTFIKYSSGWEKLARICNQPTPRPQPMVYWFTGPSGSGKTRFARDLCDRRGWSYYVKQPEFGKWYDNYNGQDVIIFDDFDCEQSLGEMLRLIDYGPLQFEVKGGVRPVETFRFIFTLHRPYNECYIGHEKHADWCRRIEEYGVYTRDFATAPYIGSLDPYLSEYAPPAPVQDLENVIFD